MKKAILPLLLSLGGIVLTFRWIELYDIASAGFFLRLILFGCVAQWLSGWMLAAAALMKKAVPLWLSIGLWYVFIITTVYVLWVCFCGILSLLGYPWFPAQS